GEDFLTSGSSNGSNVAVKGTFPPPKYSIKPKPMVSPPTATSSQNQKEPHACTRPARIEPRLTATTTTAMTWNAATNATAACSMNKYKGKSAGPISCCKGRRR